MLFKLLKTLVVFCIGFALGLIAVFLNGEFIIHVPIVMGIVAVGFYVTKPKWWSFWTRGFD